MLVKVVIRASTAGFPSTVLTVSVPVTPLTLTLIGVVEVAETAEDAKPFYQAVS